MSTKRSEDLPRAWGATLGVAGFSIVVAVGLAANVLTGVNWAGIRAEFDRFAEAMWRKDEKKSLPSQEAAAKTDRSDLKSASRDDASPREINLGGIRLPDIRIGDVKLPQLVIGDREAVANYVRFEHVAFSQGVMVTGREYRENRRGEKPYRQYCYAERVPPADGVKVWVNVAGQQGSNRPEYATINDKQAAAIGIDAGELARLTRELCRLVEGQGDHSEKKE